MMVSFVVSAASAMRLKYLPANAMFLMLVLVVPWYWAAECRTPGFLRYFRRDFHPWQDDNSHLLTAWQTASSSLSMPPVG